MPRHDDTTEAFDDWAPGDLALCVRGGFLEGLNVRLPGQKDFPKAGAVYHVTQVSETDMLFKGESGPALKKTLSLFFDDAPQNGSGGERVWGAHRFKKIKPPSKDETIEAMKEIVSDSFVKVKVPNERKKVKS